MSAYVYRAFDRAGRLLYVGCASDVGVRLGSHAKSSPWWIYHDRVESEWFETRQEAEAAEARAIATEHPRWNINGRSASHPDGFASAIRKAPWLEGEIELYRSLNLHRQERARLVQKIEGVDRDLAAVCALVDQISRGELEYGRDYDLDGPLTARERKERALEVVRGESA